MLDGIFYANRLLLWGTNAEELTVLAKRVPMKECIELCTHLH